MNGTNALINRRDGTHYQAVVIYQCLSGYRLDNTTDHVQKIECTADQEWTHTIDPCYRELIGKLIEN